MDLLNRMDHGDHGGGDDGCPMIMKFHAGHCETILWDGWTAKTEVEFVFSALGIFVIAFIYEGLKYLRERYYVIVAQAETLRLIENRSSISGNNNNGPCCTNSVSHEQKPLLDKIFNKAHTIQTFLHFLQLIISYLLMLIVMSFNYWLFAAVVLGASAGYFCFGWIRQQASDVSEHCH